MSAEIKPPELPKAVVDKLTDEISDKSSLPFIPSFIKKAYIRKAIENTWRNIWSDGRYNKMLFKVWQFLSGKKTWLGFILYGINNTLPLFINWTPNPVIDKMAEALGGAGLIHKADKLISGIRELKQPTPPQA